jgi:hypothetical protein
MSTLTAPRFVVKARRPVVATAPARGSFRWAAQPTDTHPGCLVITSETKAGPVVVSYLVHAVFDGPRHIGYRLSKPSGEVYDLAADCSTCDCADATFHPERPGGCKHQRALRAALASLANS